MMTEEINPLSVILMDRMTRSSVGNIHYISEPIDLTRIDALALGDLWTVASSIVQAKSEAFHLHQKSVPDDLATETARSILKLGEEREPAFRGSACRDYLNMLADRAEKDPSETKYVSLGSIWNNIRFALTRCIDLTFDELGPAATRFLAVAHWPAKPHLSVALARIAGCEDHVLEKLAAAFSDSPLLVEELFVVAAIDLAAQISLDDILPSHGGAPLQYDSLPELFDDPDYATFAQGLLKRAAERVRRIHDHEVPFAADKAFTLQESPVIARTARVALSRDEPWLPSVLEALFRRVSLAPTAAKSMPSQSVAVALGHAIEAFPTPESVATLREVARENRHAGVKKKLERNLRGAERALGDRPGIALRLPTDQAISKSQLATLTRALEAGLTSRMTLTYEDWHERLAIHTHAKAIAGALVWRLLDPVGGSVSILPVAERGHLTLQDVTGNVLTLSTGGRVMLWHPSDVTEAERLAWRDRFATLRIKQPFRQVFREHYALSDDELSHSATAMFSGHVVSVVPFLGLARRERWRLGYAYLTRPFAQWTARLDLDDSIYPGYVGSTKTGNLSLWTSSSKNALPVRLGDVPAATLSEILRAVDLLVSVGGFALTDENMDAYRRRRLRHLAESSISDMAEMRKQALQRMLPAAVDAQFDRHHLRVGPYAIHLATGRVTRDGEPVTIELPERASLSAVSWLPYDEKLLEKIYYTAVGIGDDVEAKKIKQEITVGSYQIQLAMNTNNLCN